MLRAVRGSAAFQAARTAAPAVLAVVTRIARYWQLYWLAALVVSYATQGLAETCNWVVLYHAVVLVAYVLNELLSRLVGTALVYFAPSAACASARANWQQRLLRTVCAFVSGAAVVLSVRAWVNNGSQSSSQWLLEHASPPEGLTARQRRPLAGLNAGAFVISLGPNAFRAELERSLQEFGLEAGDIHIVPALNAKQCRPMGPAYAPLTGVLGLARDIAAHGFSLGSCHSDECGIRCHPGGRFCPAEADPTRHDFFECKTSPLLPPHPSFPAGGGRDRGGDGDATGMASSLSPPPGSVFLNTTRTFLKRPHAVQEAAVAASHLTAIHTAYLAGHDVALIFEDDASAALVPHWGDMGLAEVLSALPEDWHSVQLHVWLGLRAGGAVRTVDIMQKRLAHGMLVSPRDLWNDAESWGAVAYAMSRRGMEALLQKHWQAPGWVAPPRSSSAPPSALSAAVRARGPLVDLTEFPISDLLVYSLPRTFTVNRPLFSHQLGGVAKHTSSVHSGHLDGHERSRRRALACFYGPESEYVSVEDELVEHNFRWLSISLQDLATLAVYFADGELLFGVPLVVYWVFVPIVIWIAEPDAVWIKRQVDRVANVPTELLSSREIERAVVKKV